MAQASALIHPPAYDADCSRQGQQFSIQQQPMAPILQSQPVVIVQPSPNMSQPLPEPVPDYMGYSIFTTLCCCICLGLAALSFSRATKRANAAGQRAEAAKNSQTALILNHISLVVGFILIVIYLLNEFYFQNNDVYKYSTA